MKRRKELRVTQDAVDAMIQDYQNGEMSVAMIAKKYGVCESEVYGFCKANSALHDNMAKTYLKSGLTCAVIAKLHGYKNHHVVFCAIRNYLHRHRSLDSISHSKCLVRKSHYKIFVNAYNGSLIEFRVNVLADIKMGLDKFTIIKKYDISENIMDGLIEYYKDTEKLPRNFRMLSLKEISHAYRVNEAIQMIIDGMHIDDVMSIHNVHIRELNSIFMKSKKLVLDSYDIRVGKYPNELIDAVMHLKGVMTSGNIAKAFGVSVTDVETILNNTNKKVGVKWL